MADNLQSITKTVNLEGYSKSCNLKTKDTNICLVLDKYSDSNICFYISFVINYIIFGILIIYYYKIQ